MKNKKSILDSFINVPQEFISFLNTYRYRPLQKAENKDKLIKKIYTTAIDKDYVIIHTNIIYYCNKNQYKQVLFNIRSKKTNAYKKLLKKYNKLKTIWKNVVTYKKIEFANSFEVSIYDIRKNKFQTVFRPFVSMAEATALKYSGLSTYSKEEIKRGVIRFPDF